MWCPETFRLLPCFLLLLTVGFVAEDLRAAERIILLDADIRQEYSDNLFFTDTEEEDDARTSISPGLRIHYGSERTSADLRVGLSGLIYASNSELNAVDQLYRFDAAHQYSPRLYFSAYGTYIRDHRPDRDIETTGLIYSASRRDRWQGGITGRYMMTELMSLEWGYRFSEDAYEDPELTDTRSHSLNMGMTYDLGRYCEGMAGRLTAGYDRYIYPQTRYDNYWLTMGISYRFNEKWEMMLDLGGRFTRARSHFMTPYPVTLSDDAGYLWLIGYEWREETITSDTSGGTGGFTLTYQALFDQLDFGISQGLYAASGQGESSNRTSLTARYRRRISADFGFSFFTAYYINLTDRGNSGIDAEESNTLRVVPGIWYELTPELKISGGYQLTYVDDEATHRHRNLVFFMLSGKHEWGN